MYKGKSFIYHNHNISNDEDRHPNPTYRATFRWIGSECLIKSRKTVSAGRRGPPRVLRVFIRQKEVKEMMPKLQLMVIRKPEYKCSEKLDCHERHNCRSVRQKVVAPGRIQRFVR